MKQTSPISALTAALAAAIGRYSEANPKSLTQHLRASTVLPGGNTRSVLFTSPFPITLESGHGARVRSVDGDEYIDFLGEYTAGLSGHSNEFIAAAIKAALDTGIVLGGHTQLEERFAALLTSRFASLEKVRFTNSGTEANLLAICTAVKITGREAVMVFDGSYHGSILNFGSAKNPINAPHRFLRAPYNDIDRTAAILDMNAADVAAVIVEPMLGSGGCIPAEPEFLRFLREWCSGNRSILIFDEVMTSRLSPGGLQLTLGIRPDLTTLGKYLGGGLTFGAFGGRADIMDRFDPRRPDSLSHAGTFNNNVLTMSAGIAGLTRVYTPDAIVTLNRRGDELRDQLNALALRAAVPIQITGIGSMMNVHMSARPIRTYSDVSHTDQDLRDLLYYDLTAKGLWCARRGMLNLSLPMTAADLLAVADALAEFFEERKDLLGV